MVTVELDIPQDFLDMLTRRRGHATLAEYITALIEKDDDLMWDEQFAATTDEQWDRIIPPHLNVKKKNKG